MTRISIPGRMCSAIVAGAWLLSACSANPPASSQTTAVPEPTAPSVTRGGVRIGDRTMAMAKVVPAATTDLTFGHNGVIAEVMVKDGDMIAAGTPIARLESSSLELEVDVANAALAEAQASYKALLAGSTPEQIEIAKARVTRAEAQLLVAKSEVTSDDVNAANKRLESAKAALEQIKRGTANEDVRAQQAALDAARAELSSTKSKNSAGKTTAQSEMLQAANVLRNTQSAYARARAAFDAIGKPTEDDKEALAEAERNMENAAEGYKQRKVVFEQLTEAEASGNAAAEARVRQAQAGLDSISRPADAARIALAEADIATAQAVVSRASGAGREATIKVVEASVQEANAALKALQSDVRPEALAAAQAHVLQTEVTLKRAKAELAGATLRAPWTGTVLLNKYRAGELLPATEAVATLADFSAWFLQTEDLNEISIVHIREGSDVTINFPALPGIELTGVVTRVSPVGSVDKNYGAIYAVTIAPSRWDDRLRWNMTASVSIKTAS